MHKSELQLLKGGRPDGSSASSGAIHALSLYFCGGVTFGDALRKAHAHAHETAQISGDPESTWPSFYAEVRAVLVDPVAAGSCLDVVAKAFRRNWVNVTAEDLARQFNQAVEASWAERRP